MSITTPSLRTSKFVGRHRSICVGAAWKKQGTEAATKLIDPSYRQGSGQSGPLTDTSPGSKAIAEAKRLQGDACDLKARMEAFIDYFNDTLAKPFKWTMTGKPLAA